MQLHKPLVIALLFILSAGSSFATHFYGVDMFYTHVAGNVYRVSLVAYGDCSGQQFLSFATTRPLIYIKKGNAAFAADYLDHEPPVEGVEVTPVCPAELSHTTCVDPAGTVPGVKRFVYSKEFTLSGPAPDWRFIFLGETDGNTIAGRSNSLTNVSPAGVISMEATLNNANDSNNSSPVYTTIATPFYCVNKPTNFNPGAVDADGDSLVYELVPALNGVTTATPPLAYVSGFTGSNPLDVNPGAFRFSTKTGQLNFTPRSIQRSLVVYRVYEYRKGVLVGTSMREMTVVVMPCNNNPPAGYITNAAGADIVDSVTVSTCKSDHEVAFDINPTDADGHMIKMEVNGLPGNSRLDITANSTTKPLSRFSWSMVNVPEGDYTFFVTYTDNGCPIASRQVQAYTVRIVAGSILCKITNAGCVNQGFVHVTAPPDWLPWNCKVSAGTAPVYDKNGINSESWGDSLAKGQYKIEVVNHLGCKADTTVGIISDCYIVDLPTAFSPNGDGANEMLLLKGTNIKEMLLRVYNRWGQIVFETQDRNIGWDGKYRGQDAPAEAYAYVLSGVFTNGQVFQKEGNITLLR